MLQAHDHPAADDLRASGSQLAGLVLLFLQSHWLGLIGAACSLYGLYAQHQRLQLDRRRHAMAEAEHRARMGRAGGP